MERVSVQTDWGKHNCFDAIIRCIDHRVSGKELIDALNSATIGQRKIERSDDLTGAGGALAVLRDEYWPLIRDGITVAVKKHGIKRLFLVNHHDCGAYGGVEKFGGDLLEEEKFHLEQLSDARQKLVAFLNEINATDVEVLIFYWGEKELKAVAL